MWKTRLVILLAGVVLIGWALHRYYFPYGQSHCCILGVGTALHAYAEDHGGHFPFGGKNPEASLSLLYSNYLDAYTLRGKTVPLKTVQEALAQDGKLGPESCGWHYVEGLTEADDPGIAIVWDKVGLGHNGERLKRGGHEVIFVDGDRRFISAVEWTTFLERQKTLLAKRDIQAIKSIPALVATIHLPTGQMLDHYDGPYVLNSTETDEYGAGHGTQSGSGPQLRWYRFVPDGHITWILILTKERLRSKPISFDVKDGRATPTSIIFEMEKF